MRHDSLRLRLILASSVWIAAALILAGSLLVALFRAQIERRFDLQIYDHMEELVAASEPIPGGGLKLTWRPADARFARPLSGWYWQIASEGKTLHQSRSLRQDPFPATPPGIGHVPVYVERKDAQGMSVRAIVQDVTFPDTEPAFTFLVAGPRHDIDADVSSFTTQLAAMLAMLAVVLITAVVLQVAYGLKPLARVRSSLADIRAGRAARLPKEFPQEIRPMVNDFNALLDHRETMIERARAQAGDLAHALKTPLTVLRNEARTMRGKRGRLVSDYLEQIGAVIARHLSRARAAGARQLPGSTAELRTVLEDLRYSMERLYGDKTITVRLKGGRAMLFAGDSHDLEEMLGNLLDNACKWAKSTVIVSAHYTRGRLRMTIEDDGPGLLDKQRKAALKRGGRLDESMPGSGLGLTIVQELAALYGGKLTLGRSDLGGLAARLDLPSPLSGNQVTQS